MEKIKYLLQKKQYFKANLHTHSTISDGKLSPQEVKDAYKKMGYQILCLTDHNTIIDHSDMNDPDFLMLTGAEININSEDYKKFKGSTYHLNLIAKRADNLQFPARMKRWFAVDEEIDNKIRYGNLQIQYDPKSINKMIAWANKNDFLVMYNHPTWSCQTYPDYAPLKGLWGMEVQNTECCMLGHNENNIRVYKDMLNQGHPIFPLGTDDMHSPRALGKSWIMVGAKELTYASVIDALEKGDFYMSCGPEITEITFQGDSLKISCSDAQSVRVETYGRLGKFVAAEGEPLREVTISLENVIEKTQGDPASFIYITVTAPDGTYAVTRPYYLKDML